MLDVGDRRTVEFHQAEQGKDALIYVEKRHMATKTAGERGGGNFDFLLGHLSHPFNPRTQIRSS